MKYVKIVLNILLCVFIVLLLFVLVANVYFLYNQKVLKNYRATFLGFSYQVGMNYSMEPTLKQNDFLITKKQENYKLNDIVTFLYKDSGKVTTHRIVEITENGYITKGDSELVLNKDKEITNDEIIGKVVVVIPFIGAVLVILKNPFGLLLIISIIAICFFLIKSLIKSS